MEMAADNKGKIGVEDDDKANENPTLPQEIIVEILSRLPVKSLCKFRCVAKPWLSLISDPQFVHTHLRRTIENHDLLSRSRRFLVTDSTNIYSVNFESIHDDIEVRELDYPQMKGNCDPCTLECNFRPNFLNSAMDWLGSCYGLVCINVDAEYCLFNPATTEYKLIPEVLYDTNANCGRGFGYDRENDDFKLVDVSDNCWVNSLRSGGKWRRVEYFFGWKFFCGTGLFLEDSIHWVVGHEHNSSELFQLGGFNLITETFWEWDMPDRFTRDRSVEFTVGAVGGSLSLIHRSFGMQDQFWMMTKYGKQDSWTKINVSFSHMRMIPLCLSVTGGSLWEIHDNNKLFLYNFEDDRSVELDECDFPLADVLSYVETLISPHAFCKNLQDGIQM